MGFDDYLTTRMFLLREQVIRESHKTRDPLLEIDSIYVPAGPDHQWGQQKDPSRSGPTKTDTIKGAKKGDEAGPSTAEDRLESQEGNPPTKPDTVKI